MLPYSTPSYSFHIISLPLPYYAQPHPIMPCYNPPYHTMPHILYIPFIYSTLQDFLLIILYYPFHNQCHTFYPTLIHHILPLHTLPTEATTLFILSCPNPLFSCTNLNSIFADLTACQNFTYDSLCIFYSFFYPPTHAGG